MSEFDANRLVLMLIYNFAQFLPADPDGAAIKKNTWIAELLKYDVKKAEKAVRTLVETRHYPPQIADLREAMGASSELTREDMQARLPGPTFGSSEGYKAMYTANMERVDQLMEDLMEELRWRT